MKSKLLGACSVIILAFSVDRSIPTQTETLADICVPILTGALGILACIGTWKEKKWGISLALAFSLFQLFAICYLAVVTPLARTRALESILLLIVSLSTILLLTKYSTLKDNEPNNAP